MLLPAGGGARRISPQDVRDAATFPPNFTPKEIGSLRGKQIRELGEIAARLPPGLDTIKYRLPEDRVDAREKLRLTILAKLVHILGMGDGARTEQLVEGFSMTGNLAEHGGRPTAGVITPPTFREEPLKTGGWQLLARAQEAAPRDITLW